MSTLRTDRVFARPSRPDPNPFDWDTGLATVFLVLLVVGFVGFAFWDFGGGGVTPISDIVLILWVLMVVFRAWLMRVIS